MLPRPSPVVLPDLVHRHNAADCESPEEGLLRQPRLSCCPGQFRPWSSPPEALPGRTRKRSLICESAVKPAVLCLERRVSLTNRSSRKGHGSLADWETGGVVFADDLGGWLVGRLADTARKRLTTWSLGSKQERALRQAGAAAVRLTVEELCPEGGKRAHELTVVMGQTSGVPVPEAPMRRHCWRRCRRGSLRS
jgi:hypothetical protein